MKILFTYISGNSDRNDQFISLLPTGLCYLHSTLREAGYQSLLANFSGWSEAAVAEQLTALQPDIVGISQWTHNRHASLDLARLVRQLCPDCTIVLGGAHATFRHDRILEGETPVDIVVLGEGEATLLDLAGRMAAGKGWEDLAGIAFRKGGRLAVNPPQPVAADLDHIPFAALHLEDSVGVDQELQAEFIVTARGCPSACRFCSSPGFWGRRVAFRSPESVVDEIMYLRDKYGLIYFSLRDDTFTADRRRAIAICQLLIERKAYVVWNCQSRVNSLDEELVGWMKRAGCECIQLGIESGSPLMLELLGKSITTAQVERAAAAIKAAGINLSVYLIGDIPEEAEEDLTATIALMRRIRPDDGYVSPLAYYPGTRLFDDAVAARRVPDDIFENSPEPAIYAAAKTGLSSRRLLKAIAGAGHGGSPGRFARQKRLLGYCHATNVLAGEWYRQSGDAAAAEREFREICDREPDNPWGWYLLGELYAERGKGNPSRECFQRVLALVPKHAPSRAAVDGKR
ncbi:B12-binding domain-containing radical SAM protein [Geobacter sp. SVR]|uniref:B12-binding domain-containing radical SAM protein n=1 Tax=Geobacter sp. SVR TaxID=2495594 RepID=UPI001564E4D2|nr:cobalamin-dependent protein [Geobacter sp. SVR]